MEPTGWLAAGTSLAAAAACVWAYRANGRWLAEVRDRDERLRVDRAEFERERAEALLAGRQALDGQRGALEDEYRERRAELQRVEARLEAKEQACEERRGALDQREALLSVRAERLHADEQAQRAELERIGGLSAEEAKALLVRRLEDDARRDAAQLVRQIEEDARREGAQRARGIVGQAMERCAVEHMTESVVSVVPLPSDEVKGRIIGREGRNIRSFEQLTGVDLLIDDTPEAVVISAFCPLRRAVARTALEMLVADGRIHPGRIEEVVEQAQRQVAQRLAEAGEAATLDSGVSGLAPALVELLGKLSVRTSYGQNVLSHSLEVAQLAAIMATELGADVAVARRAALLHDIGKATDGDAEGPHALLGMELARRHGESAAVCHAVGAHHRDLEPTSLEAVLVLTADAVSAARPGARRDSLEQYIQRLTKLEELAEGFPGVDRAYAIQAGREMRVIVRPEAIDDAATGHLAREIATRIESDLVYPGQIKVTVIREQRSVEYAR
jgi:ribonuclease Y